MSRWYSHSSVALSDHVSLASVVEVALACRSVGRTGLVAAAAAPAVVARQARLRAPQSRVLLAGMGVELLGRARVARRTSRREARGRADRRCSSRGAPNGARTVGQCRITATA